MKRICATICLATLALLVLLGSSSAVSAASRSFIIGDSTFLKDGQPFRIISGSLHYFRVHPALWRDRLEKFKAAGLNTVQTYVPWNLHQPQNNSQFNYEGILDIRQFIQTAADVGLLVTVRPAPYICAEWEFGGFPGWLIANSDVRLRTSEPTYMKALQTFMDDFLPRVYDLQYQLGGPVIIFQIENEYGTYGDDWEYLRAIRKMYLDHGIETLLITCNGDQDYQMIGGNIPELFSPTYLRTVNFGQATNVTVALAQLRKYQPTGPLFVTEYWPGWFDEWQKTHQTRDGKIDASQIDKILAAGGSVNMYMFHGGTNFGFTNGAEQNPYSPLVTSYDYDAPLSEAGDPTEKFNLIRNVIAKYTKIPSPTPQPGAKKAYGNVPLSLIGNLFDPAIYNIVAHKSVDSAYPKTMEQLGENFGFVHYSAKLRSPTGTSVSLSVPTLHDSSLVYMDGKYQGALLRDQTTSMNVVVPKLFSQLDLLVENLGRINFGTEMQNEYKGIMSAQIQGAFISQWRSTAIPLADEDVVRLANLTASSSSSSSSRSNTGGFNPSASNPSFWVGYFDSPAPVADTFLQATSWTKGSVWINGFNLGRYWCVGPQGTLYVPSPLLKPNGRNQIILFDSYGPLKASQQPVVSLVDAPNLSQSWC